MKKQAGFTLIELVVVIVILGILAATALPKFTDLSSDARRSAVQGMAGALSSAAAINYSTCLVKGTSNAACKQLNAATACASLVATNLSGWDPTKYEISADATCASVASGTSVQCTIRDKVDTTITATATAVCTG